VTSRAERLDSSWLGRTLSIEMLGEFARLDVDPCGENGEYHTLVTNSPLFREPLHLVTGEHVLRSGCWVLDVRVSGSRFDGVRAGSDPGVQQLGAETLQKLHGV
jgi:diphthamide synthase (EF-2-diphthine--ammonia ligase)